MQPKEGEGNLYILNVFKARIYSLKTHSKTSYRNSIYKYLSTRNFFWVFNKIFFISIFDAVSFLMEKIWKFSWQKQSIFTIFHNIII